MGALDDYDPFGQKKTPVLGRGPPKSHVQLLTDLATRLTDRAFKEVARADDDAFDHVDQAAARVAAVACKVVAEELIATLQNGSKPDG